MSNQFCILFHYHEISLKGKNRSWFERQLIKNIKIQLKNLPLLNIKLISARIFCYGIDVSRWNEYAGRINKIMGIKHATLMEKNICTIDEMEKSEVKVIDHSEYKEIFHYFLVPGLVLLLLEIGLSNTLLRRIP